MTFVYILLILILLTLVFLIIKSKKANSDDLSKEISNSLNQIFPQVLKNANQQLITLADQKIGTDLNNKKQAIEELVHRALTEIEKNNKKMEEVEIKRTGSFSTLTEKLEEQKALTNQLKVTTEGLKNVLSNNQLRGQFGEQVAEDLLKMSGFVSGVNYDKQVSGESSRPDFTVYMPDGMKINVDSKFPYQNLVKMSEVDGKEEKEKFKKLFEQDIKTKIKEVTSREYINPEKNTVDFVILFIPNEMIFSFIYDRFPNVWQEAMGQKVILAGPFSFTAILRMVHQAYDNFRYQKNVANIIGYIKKFSEEFDNYNKGFKDLGTRIEALQKQYTAVDTTRTKQLVKIVNKIKPKKLGISKKFMNRKFIYFSIFFWLTLIFFIIFISPEFLWSKISLFLLFFSSLISTIYIFSKNHYLNVFISLYFVSLLILQFFHQFFVINFILITGLFISLYFIFDKKDIK